MSENEGSKAITIQLGPSRLAPHRYPEQLVRSLLGIPTGEGLQRLLDGGPLDECQKDAVRRFLRAEGVVIQVKQGEIVRALSRDTPLSREVLDPDSAAETTIGISRPMKGGTAGAP